MKTYLILLLALVGCGRNDKLFPPAVDFKPYVPLYKPGDCISYTSKDEFNPKFYLEKVLEVGKSQYHLAYFAKPFQKKGGITFWYDHGGEDIETVDQLYQPAKCPDVK